MKYNLRSSRKQMFHLAVCQALACYEHGGFFFFLLLFYVWQTYDRVFMWINCFFLVCLWEDSLLSQFEFIQICYKYYDIHSTFIISGEFHVFKYWLNITGHSLLVLFMAFDCVMTALKQLCLRVKLKSVQTFCSDVSINVFSLIGIRFRIVLLILVNISWRDRGENYKVIFEW